MGQAIVNTEELRREGEIGFLLILVLVLMHHEEIEIEIITILEFGLIIIQRMQNHF